MNKYQRGDRIIKVKTCQQCGTLYKSSNEKFCSRDCLVAHNNSYSICLECGNEIKVPNAVNGKMKFCNKECYMKHKIKRIHGTCLNCGKDIKTYKDRPVKFCSYKCHGLFKRQNKIPDYNGIPVHIGKGGVARININGRTKTLARVIVEQSTGITLKPKNHVHHIDGNPLNNDKTNLIVLESNKEHKALHARMRIRDAGGNWRIDKICSFCKKPKPKHEFVNNHVCKECRPIRYQNYKENLQCQISPA